MEQLLTPIQFKYGEAEITFSKGEGIMINATEMAKPFGKRPVDWLRLPSTVRFMSELSEVRKLHFDKLVVTHKGGNLNEVGQGTWMNEDVALEFARWLAPAFAIWCNDKIKELLTTGKTEIRQQSDEEMILAGYKLLMSRVEQLQATIQEQAPKVEYYEHVLQSRALIPITTIAKELGTNAVALNRFLHEKRVIYKVGTIWVLYQQYQNKGYTGTKTITYLDSQNKEQSAINTYWTEKGREFIHTLFVQYQNKIA